jgi:hypothetical protein
MIQFVARARAFYPLYVKIANRELARPLTRLRVYAASARLKFRLRVY